MRRSRLDGMLQAGLEGKLCLIEAPAGFGKTILLTQYHMARTSGDIAWVSLDQLDNDPARFWSYVIEALRTVEPGIGSTAMEALQRTNVDLYHTVLPLLLNELSTVGTELSLVLDDYHLVTNPTCHEALTLFLDYLPANAHVLLSTQADPPLPLARMRVHGELTELRETDLRFTVEEATALLNSAMALDLAPQDVQRLVQRTEGWAAALHLAGLSLRSRTDPSAFIASFHGDHRHVSDFLATEVLAHQPEQIRRFLLRTSILERLSGPLCDAVLELQDSAELLRELERSNLFLISLDQRREWYRYHHLFAELLNLELAASEPAQVPMLHRRAAAWHRREGSIEAAIHHAAAAGAFAEAGDMIAEHWLPYVRRGLLATVAGWLERLPETAIEATPPVAVVAATVAGFTGASKADTERWLAAAEAGTWEGPLPDGSRSLPYAVAYTRALLLFDDVGRSLNASRRALELAGPEPSQWRWIALALVGRASYLSGQPTAAALRRLVKQVTPSDQPYAVVVANAVLSLIASDGGDDHAAAALARNAVETAEGRGVNHVPLCGIAYVASGQALVAHGKLAEAEEHLGRALELPEIDSMLVDRAHVLLVLASLRQARDDLPGARELLGQARELIEWSIDPGILPMRLQQVERTLGSTARRQVELAAPLTARELAVLRLLPTRLSLREIGRELYVSINTVRTHTQAVYRKLGAASRSEAVARARELGLLRESTPPSARSG